MTADSSVAAQWEDAIETMKDLTSGYDYLVKRLDSIERIVKETDAQVMSPQEADKVYHAFHDLNNGSVKAASRLGEVLKGGRA